MKKLILALVYALFSLSGLAAEGDKGVGILFGNPVGVSGKYWLADNHAIDGGVGMSWGRHTNLSLHSDYLLQSDAAFYYNDTIPLDLYYGLGGRMEFADEIELGLRLPVGLVHKFENDNADMFAEIAPIIDLVGRTGIELHFGFGARYYFR
jgi:hypothetical protein